MNWKSLFSSKNKKNNTTQEEYLRNYSDIPSPRVYQDCTDYDGMGDYSRFPNIIKKQ